MSSPGVISDLLTLDKQRSYAQITVTGTAALLSALATIPSWATAVLITPESGSIRYRCDGTAPTASVGQPISSGTSWPVQGAAVIAAMQLIASSSTTVSVEFLR